MNLKRRASLPKIGCHISSGGGIWKIFDRAQIAGAECLQTFAGSPQTWKPPEYSDEDVRVFREIREKNQDIGPLFIHAMYLINLASAQNNIRYGSIGALTKSLLIAESLGFDGVITHTGSAMQNTFEDVLPTLKKSLEKILAGVPANFKAKLYLENAAGSGAIIGDTVHELGELLRSADNDSRLGICIDTCHAFVSGYDIRTDAGITQLSDEIEQEFGWDRVGALHINDSKGELGSHLDRHEIIGQGALGVEVFQKMFRHPHFSQLPWILETPDLKTEMTETPPSLKALRTLRV